MFVSINKLSYLVGRISFVFVCFIQFKCDFYMNILILSGGLLIKKIGFDPTLFNQNYPNHPVSSNLHRLFLILYVLLYTGCKEKYGKLANGLKIHKKTMKTPIKQDLSPDSLDYAIGCVFENKTNATSN